MLTGDRVFPGDYLLHTIELHEADRGGEFAHPVTGALDPVLGLAVVAIGAGVLDQLAVPGYEHAALARRDRLGRVQRVDPGIAPGPGPATRPPRAVGMGAVLD